MACLVDDKVLIMLPQRHGTSWLLRALRSVYDVKLIGEHRHLAATDVADLFKTKRSIGIVRNPFSWYVSRHACIANTYREPVPEFPIWLRECVGTYTRLHFNFHCLHPDSHDLSAIVTDEMWRVESLTENVLEEFPDACVGVEDPMKMQHDPWRTYYTKALRELVERTDRLILDRYGYEFDLRERS